MARADKALHDAQYDNSADDIASPHMQGIRAAGFLFGAQIRHGESRDERPMPGPHQRVPYEGAGRLVVRMVSLLVIVYLPRCGRSGYRRCPAYT